MAETDPDVRDDEESPTLVRAALLGLVALVAALGVLAVMLARTVVPEVVEDRPLAEKRLGELLPMQLPAGFEPSAVLDWDLLYLIPMKGVWVRGEAGGEITVLRLGGRVAADESLRRRASRALREPAAGGEVETSAKMPVMIRGREIEGTLLTVRDAGAGRRRRLTLTVPTDAGPVLVDWSQPEAAFDAEVVRQSLASIR